MNIQFHSEQLRAFEHLSHDRNPLHLDSVYARSTQFGRPVVFGMCEVLLGLGHWAGGRAFRLTRINGRFVKPLFEQVDYDLEIHEEGNQATVQYLDDGKVQMSFNFAWKNLENANGQTAPRQTPASFQPLAVASDVELQKALVHWQKLDYPYSVCVESLSQLLPKLCLQPAQMPLDQLNALMGSSYLVGMEVPGRQALYSSFEFKFTVGSDDASPAPFQFSNVSAELDTRFNRITVSGRGSGIQSFTLLAFQRPQQVRYGIEEIHLAGGHSEALKNKVVFISGATRGFGNVFAKMMALQDATILVNYRSRREEAEAITAEVRSWNDKVFPIAGDVSDLEDCRRIQREISERLGRVDFLVSNAFPQIPTRGFLEQDSCEFMKFLEQSVATTVTLFRELLPLVPKGGIVILISTCYTRQPAAGYSHYIAAKNCLEGLMRSLALEFPDQKFVIARPPRMLTDQTNLIFDLSTPVSAVTVAKELMTGLSRLENSSNFAELDLGRN